MKHKGLKITLAVLGIIVVVVVAVVLLADFRINRIVDNELRKQLAQVDEAYINYGDLTILLGQRTIQMDDIVFCTEKSDSLPADIPGVQAQVKSVRLVGFSIMKLLRTKVLDFNSLFIDEPRLLVHQPAGEQAADSLHSNLQTTNDSIQAQTAPLFTKYLHTILLDRVELHNGSCQVRGIADHTALSLDSLMVALYDVGYRFRHDTLPDTLLMDDHRYALSLRHLHLLTPDSLTAAHIGSISTQNGGRVLIHDIHAFNTVRKSQLADRMGKTQVTWSDSRLDSITTSPINLFSIWIEQRVSIDSMWIAGRSSSIFRDERYPAGEPYNMPQTDIMAIPMPFRVGYLQFTMPETEFQLVTLNLRNPGTLSFKQMRTTVTNLTNQEGELASVRMHTAFGNGGKGDITMNLRMDKAAHFDFSSHMTGLSGATFNKFAHPLFGVELECEMHDINAHVSGDQHTCKGDFCMQYDGFKIHVSEKDAPYALLQKSAGVINFFAPMIVPASNPRSKDKPAETFQVDAERDPQKIFAYYLLDPISDGVMKTLLPGFMVKIMKENQAQLK